MSPIQEIFVSVITLVNSLSLCLTMNFHLELKSKLNRLNKTLKPDFENIEELFLRIDKLENDINMRMK